MSHLFEGHNLALVLLVPCLEDLSEGPLSDLGLLLILGNLLTELQKQGNTLLWVYNVTVSY